MPLPDSGPEHGRYIIRSDDAKQLSEFIHHDVNTDPSMTLLDMIGPINQPHTVVIEMPHDTAHTLEQRFRTSHAPLIIEPDRPLSLFGNPTDATGSHERNLHG